MKLYLPVYEEIWPPVIAL